MVLLVEVAMLKVIIVEDEDIIRKGLVFTIDWLSMGCVIVAEAADGQEGLEKIIEHEPDIVITDIKMPKLDGISMIEQALMHVKFESIILTSYAEFDYAKKAIELKTYEYLLKPVDEEKIRELILKLHDEIDEGKEVDFVLENKKKNSQYLDLNYYMQLDNTENCFVSKAVQYIINEYEQKISVESISMELGISPSYLSRKFKEVTNYTFLDLLNRYRVQEAVKLLNKGNYRINEISEMTGFSDYKHFCSVFKKYTLMSPTNFVKKLK